MNTRSGVKMFFAFEFLNGFHMFAAVLIPFFVDWGGVSIAIAQGLQSWFMVCLLVLEIPTGVIADMIGHRKSLVVGSLILVPATLVYGSYPNLLIFVVAEFLFALSMAFISGADQALLYNTLALNGEEEKFNEVYGKARSIHLISIGLAALVGGVVAQTWGVNAPMLLTSIPALIAAAIAYKIPEPPDTGKIKEQRNFVSVLRRGVAPLRKSFTLRKWALNAAFAATAAYFTIWLYQPLMYELGIPVRFFGLGHAILIASEIAIAMNFGWISRTFGFSRYVNAAAILVAGSLLLAALFPNTVTLCLVIVFAGGVGLTRWDLMKAEMNKFVSKGERATTMSTIAMVPRLANSLLNPLVGFLTDRSVAFSLLVVALLPLFTLLLPIKEEETPD